MADITVQVEGVVAATLYPQMGWGDVPWGFDGFGSTGNAVEVTIVPDTIVLVTGEQATVSVGTVTVFRWHRYHDL